MYGLDLPFPQTCYNAIAKIGRKMMLISRQETNHPEHAIQKLRQDKSSYP